MLESHANENIYFYIFDVRTYARVTSIHRLQQQIVLRANTVETPQKIYLVIAARGDISSFEYDYPLVSSISTHHSSTQI